jgi:hypothetical protein
LQVPDNESATRGWVAAFCEGFRVTG